MDSRNGVGYAFSFADVSETSDSVIIEATSTGPPEVYCSTPAARVSVGGGESAELAVSRTGSDLSEPLPVPFSVKGSEIPGVDARGIRLYSGFCRGRKSENQRRRIGSDAFRRLRFPAPEGRSHVFVALSEQCCIVGKHRLVARNPIRCAQRLAKSLAARCDPRIVSADGQPAVRAVFRRCVALDSSGCSTAW